MTLALDLFSGEGAAAKGYNDAGINTIGCDNSYDALKRYPYPAILGDWRDPLGQIRRSVTYPGRAYYLDVNILRELDFIHASPICKGYSIATRTDDRPNHPKQIKEVREALQATGLPYVIENVPGSELENPVELCGCMFDLHGHYAGYRFQIYRPRWFETGGGFTFTPPPHSKFNHIGPALDVFGHGAPGRFYREFGFGIPASFTKQVMGVPWMTRDGMSQAVPPAMTEYIGKQFLAWREASAAAAKAA